MSQLNSRYFKTIHQQTNNGFEYSIIKPLNHPMILFSKADYTPLASLHFLPQSDDGNETRSLITKRPYKSEFACDFQGLINKDNQEFEFVISNLLVDGYINFNIIKQENCTGLNQINELRPCESYSVKCDQKDGLVLTLKSIKKKDLSGKTVKVSVKNDESSENGPKGTYYYLSVIPDVKCERMKELFKDTVWACVDTFCVKNKVPERKSRTLPTRQAPEGRYFSSYDREWAGFRFTDDGPSSPPSRFRSRFIDTSDDGPISDFRSSRPSYTRSDRTSYGSPGELRCVSMPEPESNTNQICDERCEDYDMDEQEDGMGCMFGSNSDDSDEAMGGLFGSDSDNSGDEYNSHGAYNESQLNNLMGSYKNNLEKTRRLQRERKSNLVNKSINASTSKSGIDIPDLHDNMEPKRTGLIDPRMGITDTVIESGDILIGKVSPIQPDIIKDSTAASVTGGSRSIKESGVHSGHEYDYTLMSCTCIISLSISEKLEFNGEPSEDDLIILGKEVIEKMIKDDVKGLLDTLTRIYKEENCTICLGGKDDEMPVDTVFYHCGHQCTHYKCGVGLSKCPLCRGFITARIKV